jgi:hypothetical protein
MTGFDSKKAAAQDKLEQWDMPSEAFNAWWDSDYDDSTNPYEKDTFAYWAWAGWQAALAQPAQKSCGCANCGKKDEDGWALYCVACIDKIKEALAQPLPAAQPAQEPVVLVALNSSGQLRMQYQDGSAFDISKHVGERFYTTPPQRPWVDLTDDEISDIAINNPPAVHEFARAVLAKSKEKNNG